MRTSCVFARSPVPCPAPAQPSGPLSAWTVPQTPFVSHALDGLVTDVTDTSRGGLGGGPSGVFLVTRPRRWGRGGRAQGAVPFPSRWVTATHGSPVVDAGPWPGAFLGSGLSPAPCAEPPEGIVTHGSRPSVAAGSHLPPEGLQPAEYLKSCRRRLFILPRLCPWARALEAPGCSSCSLGHDPTERTGSPGLAHPVHMGLCFLGPPCTPQGV